ncbi:MAG: hypothetical protein LBK00_05625 [Treponema sp.]|jgi:hypothetical protein|nr:hypothetical protein [Treponema sp.]
MVNKKNLMGGLMVVVLALTLEGCATMFNNKQTTVTAATGSANEVAIMENGSVVYQGPLPAIINVNGSNTYTVQYKDKDENLRTFQLQKKMSGWFIADILLIGGWIIDIITGDVMVYEKAVMLPIKYSDTQQGLLIDYVPDGLQKDLRIIGNLYK